MPDETRLPGDAPEANILRGKTFNQELRELVDRVTDNRGEDRLTDSGLYGPPDDIPDSISDRDLLYSLHRLFYYARNLPGMKRINTSFNPFTDWPGSAGNAPRKMDTDSAEKSLELVMTRLGMPSFAVLSYDLKQKCYAPRISTMGGVDEANLLMNVRDNLVSLIKNTDYGYILDPAAIENDSFLKARFMPSGPRGKALPLYCVLLERVTGILSGETGGQEGKVNGTSGKHMLLAFLEGKWADSEPEALCSALQSAAAVPFLIISSGNFTGREGQDFGDLEYLQGIVEYYSVLCSRNSDISALIISRHGEYTTEGAYYLYYLKARLSALLSSDTAMVRLTREIFLIITPNMHIAKIKDSIEEFNSITGDSIVMDIINDNECRDPRFVLHRMLYL